VQSKALVAGLSALCKTPYSRLSTTASISLLVTAKPSPSATKP